MGGSRRIGRLGKAVLAVMLLTIGVGGLTAGPAQAQRVANPGGGFSLKVQSGFLRIKDNSFSFVDEGRQPQCSDGQNNNDQDQDNNVDYPADSQCTSASDDSEIAGGFQPKQPIQMNNGTVNADGTMTFPASGVSFPPQYLYVDASSASGGIISDFIVTITISPLQNFTGSVNPLTGAMNLHMRVRVDADGGPLDGNCRIEPIDINSLITGTTSPPGPNTPITGSPYDPSTGRARIVNNSFSVPGAQGCGSAGPFGVVNLNDEINNQLGLPSAAGNNEAQFLVEFTPIRPTPAIVAAFARTPASAPAPISVSFNAAASTSVRAVSSYQWDFTNNGSFDASGVTTSNTYSSPGTYTARLRVTDDQGDFDEALQTITVQNNLAPTANDQTVSTAEDTAKGITLTGSDPESRPLTFALNSPNAAHGTVTGTPPNVTYTPALNYNGPDSFGFRVTDDFGNVDTGLVTVNVTAVNDAPVASNVSASTTEDTAVPVTLVATDVDGNALNYSIVTPPAKGSLSGGSGASRTYTPNANENGTDTFTFRAADPSGALSNIATGTITIAAINDAPVAGDQLVTTNEDTAVSFTLTASDAEPGPLTFSLVTLPAHGTLSGALPNLTYTPAANSNGPDSFVFRAADSTGASDTGTINIDVVSVNDPPTTSDVTVSTTEDTPVTVSIAAHDLDGDALSYTPTSPTANGGTVTCNGSDCTYTPASGFAGTDTFSVLVGDGNGGTATSNVTVNVVAFNNASPVLDDTDVIVIEDTARSFSLAATDADGDPITYTVTDPPAQGTLSCTSAGACNYTPASNDDTAEQFAVQVSDGRGGVDDATITLLIVPANDAPSAAPANVTTDEDTAATLDLVATDPDTGDSFAWIVKRAPSNGSVTCTAGGDCTYTPAENFAGADSFDAEVDDGNGGRTLITVPVTVNPVDDAPTAGTVPVSLVEDGSVSFALVGNDVEGPVTFTADPATLGTLGCDSSGGCLFTANPNATGTDTIAYTVSDGTATVTGAIVITIAPANDAPDAAPMTVGTLEDTPVSFTIPGTDSDAGDTVTFTYVTLPAHGSLSGTLPDLTYTPGANANGPVSFDYQVTDAAGASDVGTVTIDIAAIDDAPVANSLGVTLAEDTSKAVALTGSDVEGPVAVTITSPPVHGSYASGTYTPEANYFGLDSIAFQVTDGGGQTANGLVTITVTGVNDLPVAFDSSFATTRTVAIPITLNASDADGETLAVEILTGPGHGTLTGSGLSYSYQPAGLYTGPDVFTYKVTDASGAVASATITISISAGVTATQIEVHPATVTKPLIGDYRYKDLSATLRTDGGVPIPGQRINFKVKGGAVCAATTNAAGTATCSGPGPRQDTGVYTATFKGTAEYLPSSDTGVLTTS